MMNTEWGDFPRAAEHGGNLEPELRVVADDVLCSTLSHHGLVVVRGPDADQFLQGQLTCDVREVTLERSLLGAYCSPKGRALACFRLFRRNDGLYLELPRDLVSPTLARLSKYVLRAKVTLEDASDHLVCLGIAGPNAAALALERLDEIPETVNGVLHSAEEESALTVIRLPGAIPRFELYGTASKVHALWNVRDERLRFTTGIEPWQALEILAGIPAVYPETVDAFVPQMLNLDLLGGISFQKGCYTGQEIVARTHYLGKLKRRMYLARVESPMPPKPGDPLFSPQADTSQSAGQLADACRHPDGGYVVLAVALINSAEHGTLHLISTDGPVLRLEALPYGFGTAVSH